MDEPMLQFFEYGHLPEALRAVSAPFGLLAQDLVDTLPRNPERTVALRKLLEAKDCAVRAKLYSAEERRAAAYDAANQRHPLPLSGAAEIDGTE